MVINAAFNGVGRPLPGVVISATRMFLLYLPLSYFLSQYFGIPGIFIGAALANCLSGVLAIWWFNRLCNERLITKSDVSEQPPSELNIVP